MTDEHQFCLFTIDGHLFGVEVSRVLEVVRVPAVTPLPLAPGPVLGLVNLRGGLVAALDPRPLLGLAGPRRHPAGNGISVRTCRGPILLMVDRVEDVRSVEASALEPPPPTITGPGRDLIRGAYKLDCLLLILDPDRLAQYVAPLPEVAR